MNRLPIRLRLTLFFTVATAVVLDAIRLFLYTRVASDLDHSLNLELRSRAQDLSVQPTARGEQCSRICGILPIGIVARDDDFAIREAAEGAQLHHLPR